MRFCLAIVLLLACSNCNLPRIELNVLKIELKTEPTGDGLLITKYILSPNEVELKEIISEFGSALSDDRLVADLETEGLQVRRMDTVDVPALIASIGTVCIHSSIWHGQIVQWRDLEQRQIPNSGLLISESGKSYFVDSGFLSLLARSWLVQRENDLFVYLQLLPSWHVPKVGGITLGLGSIAKQSTLFSNIEIEILLSEGEALVLASELSLVSSSNGPQIEGPPPVRLGEALLGGSGEAGNVVLLVVEANILARE
jgi:hypothetical protein